MQDSQNPTTPQPPSPRKEEIEHLSFLLKTEFIQILISGLIFFLLLGLALTFIIKFLFFPKSSITSPPIPTPKMISPSPLLTPDLYTESSRSVYTEPSRSATANWKTYINDTFKISFKYPISASFPSASSLKEQNNKESSQYQIFIQTPGLNFVLDIQILTPQLSKYYLGSKYQETQTINSINWDILVNQGYCDAGSCDQPFLVYQAIKDNYRYAFIFNNTTIKTELQNQILSTFKFL